MKQFRVIFKHFVSEWLNADDWSVEDFKQFLEYPNVKFEYR